MNGCEVCWRLTGDPWVLADAIRRTSVLRQTIPAWLNEAIFTLSERRTKAQAMRALEAESRVRRYLAVDLAKRRGRSWEEAYADAADVLAGTKAAGEPETMRKAYAEVARDIKAGRLWRHFIPQRRRKPPKTT